MIPMEKDKNKTYRKALDKMESICSKKEMCKSNILRKLQSYPLKADETEAIIAQLEKEGFIDEERFAAAFVHDKWVINKWGRHKIRVQLLQKGIPEGHVQKALQHIDEEQYRNMLAKLLQDKATNMSEPDPIKRKAKLVRYAMNKGFEQDLIYNLMERDAFG